MKKYQPSLFGDTERLTLNKAIELTAEKLRQHQHKHWFISFSGGKDSTATACVVAQLIAEGRIPRPESLTVLYADTRLELPPLQQSAQAILAEMRRRGFATEVVMAPMEKRFLPYILGRGVPPPQDKFRWCTGKIKVEPMVEAIARLTTKYPGERVLQLTGVRLGESDVRDARIVKNNTPKKNYSKIKERWWEEAIADLQQASAQANLSPSCSKDGGECGQGYFQTDTAPNADTDAPILHWRVCHVWDYLMFDAPMHGFPSTLIAEAYGGDEAAELEARTGCMGCPLVSRDMALENLAQRPEWSYLQPMTRLRSIYDEMRSFDHRLQKDGTERKKDGTLVKNPGRKGPLTLEARRQFLDQILALQDEVNASAIRLGRPLVDILNPEEVEFIEGAIAANTWPDRWTGTEPLGNVQLPETYSDGSVQPLLWGAGDV